VTALDHYNEALDSESVDAVRQAAESLSRWRTELDLTTEQYLQQLGDRYTRATQAGHT